MALQMLEASTLGPVIAVQVFVVAISIPYPIIPFAGSDLAIS